MKYYVKSTNSSVEEYKGIPIYVDTSNNDVYIYTEKHGQGRINFPSELECIEYIDDWLYNSSDDINVLKELMQENISKQDDPELGIFWYDTQEDELFGIKSADVNDVPFYKSSLFDNMEVKTCRPLHYKVWEKEYHKGKDKRVSGDYTQVPRGRVFYVKDKGFIVVVGDWIDEYPNVKSLIKTEFNLPDSTEFRKDPHWNLGHGWSDKFI